MARSYARDWRGRFAGLGGGGGARGTVSVLRGGRTRSMSRRHRAATVLQTRGVVNIVTGGRAPKALRPGTPIRGNPNRRYVSRTQATLSGVSKAAGGIMGGSPGGRAHSAIVARRAGNKNPQSGYIIQY